MSDAGHCWRDHQRDELKGGLANYLDVLIAQRNLFEAGLSFTATHRLHLVSIVQL